MLLQTAGMATLYVLTVQKMHQLCQHHIRIHSKLLSYVKGMCCVNPFSRSVLCTKKHWVWVNDLGRNQLTPACLSNCCMQSVLFVFAGKILPLNTYTSSHSCFCTFICYFWLKLQKCTITMFVPGDSTNAVSTMTND